MQIKVMDSEPLPLGIKLIARGAEERRQLERLFQAGKSSRTILVEGCAVRRGEKPEALFLWFSQQGQSDELVVGKAVA